MMIHIYNIWILFGEDVPGGEILLGVARLVDQILLISLLGIYPYIYYLTFPSGTIWSFLLVEPHYRQCFTP
jgi:hypothetical protein